MKNFDIKFIGVLVVVTMLSIVCYMIWLVVKYSVKIDKFLAN